ncbi:AI-2E family transporter [Gimibacter soli]|uniref:AI-2E family transporter n=1 Tax=Gimibacter soli TaxID=3024400 RepID=A0AAE9XQ02_9PROT|nr:AI-2E family transporter [Gimibacter soli]WCL52810.1 AI-2E family transporter [Gimibacter soli]
MTMTLSRWLWIGGFLLLIGFLYLTKGILLPFVIGLAIAYLMDPVADRLEAMKVPRGIGAAIVIAVFFLAVIGILLAFWPLLQSQLANMSEKLPATLANFRPWLNGMLADLSDRFGFAVPTDVEGVLSGVSADILAKVRDSAVKLVSGGIAFFNIMGMVLISPVVAYYLLRDWDLIVARIDSWLPRHVAPDVREQAAKIDQVLAGFVRGQVSVSLSMGVIFAIGWALVGLDYALVLGLLGGILGIIPFVGAFLTALVAFVLAIGQWGFDPLHLALVAGVFVFGQIMEGSFLTPRFVGDRVGLHPVWVLFAVFAGGEVMGFVGVLVALPLAAAIAVLVRYAIERYLDHYELHPVAVNEEPSPAALETISEDDREPPVTP